MSYVYCGWLDSALKWILNNIISPIFNCIKGVLSSVFSFIYGNVLGPILDKTIYAIGRKIWEMFLDMFFESLYSIAKMVLQILDCLSDLFDTLLGVQPVIFKGEETTLLRAFLSMDAVRRAFWYINFFALGLAVIFAVYGVTRSMLDFDFENKRPVSRVMSSLLSSVLNLFTVQLAVFGIIYLAEAILTGLNSAMALAGGAAGNTTLGRMIFVLGTLNAANDESFNLSSEAVQNGSKVIGPTDTIRNKFFESSGLNPFKLSDVKTCFNIHKLDYIILIGLGMVFSFLLLVALISVVRRLFNLLLLYIVSPLFAATIPLDDGEHFGKWRNLFVGTCFTGYGMLVAMKLYLLICPTIMGSELKMSGSVELNFVCKVVFLLGGLWAVYKSSSMITSLISAEAGSAEAESVAAGTEIGKLIGGSLWTMIKSGKRPDKEGKEGQDGQNGKLGEGSQRFNGKNTGAAGTGDHGKDNAFQGDMRNRNDKLEGAGKKDDKNKNSNLFQGKAKPGKSGKSGADRTLDKFRKQFDMDNVDGLDQENKPEAGLSKNKNAYQERKGRKTTDTLGLGVGKNKKSMDALRSKFGLDAAGPEAADAKTETEDKKTLDKQNKNDTVKASDKKSKLEGNKSLGSKKAGGMTQEDNGLFGQRPELDKLDDLENVGAFGGKGKDDISLKPNKRPNMDTMSAAKTDGRTSSVPPVPGEMPPAGVHEGDNKGSAFNGTNIPKADAAKVQPNLKIDDTSNKFGSMSSKIEDGGTGFGASNSQMSNVKNLDETLRQGGVDPTIQTPNTQTFGQGGMPAGSVSSQQQTLNPGQTGNQAYAPNKGVGGQQNNMQPGTANVGVNPSPAPNGVGMGSNYQANGVPNPTSKTSVQGQEVPGPQKFDQSHGATSTVYTEQNGGSSTTNVEGGAFGANGVFSDRGQASASNTIGGGNEILRGNGVNDLNPTGPQTQESGMSYAKDDSDYGSSRAGRYRSEVLNGRTQASNGPTLMNNEVTNDQGFDGNIVENNVHRTVGGQNTQTTQTNRTNTINNIHPSVNEEIGTNGRSYANDDFGIDYGRSGAAQHTTYTQTVQTGNHSNVGFEKSEKPVEREVNEVTSDTQKVHENAQKDKNNEKKTTRSNQQQ